MRVFSRSRWAAMSYQQARWLVLGAGVVILGLVALAMYLRHVETVEVVAVLLFLPVFLAFLQWNEAGGLIVGVLAGLVYLALRASAINAVGFARFIGLVLERFIAFVVFGAAGGVANRQLQQSLTKLDLYDQIDDVTGLFNARFFVQDTDLEIARANRYRTFFGVSVVDVPMAAMGGFGGRARARLLRDLASTLGASVRSVDRVVHGADADHERFAVVLPETGPEGARIFADRMARQMGQFLAERGASLEGEVLAGVAITFPEDEASLQQLREEFGAIDRVEHPAAT